MANTKAISDEQIIAALLTHGTMRQAAEAAGTTPRTIYDRMQEREFVCKYEAAKNDIVRTAVCSINQHLEDAIDAVAEIMMNTETNPATRLQAAQTILANAAKFSERLAKSEYEQRRKETDPLDPFGTNPF